jgi:hypothetical protein
MLRVDCYDFYKLGSIIHPVMDVPDNSPFSESWAVFYFAKAELDSFFKRFPLRTSRSPATALYAALTALIPDEFAQIQFKMEDGSPRILAAWDLSSIRQAAKDFEAVIKAELSDWDTYFVSQKGAFSTSELINQAELMIPESTRKILGAGTVEDLRQAGRCVAFNLGTAACFHMVRATEAVIREYYFALLGSLPKVSSRNWGAYHRNMSKSPLADVKAMVLLKHVTENYRNPVLHPEEVVEPDDALEFINTCIALMMAMSRASEAAKITSMALGLTIGTP